MNKDERIVLAKTGAIALARRKYPKNPQEYGHEFMRYRVDKYDCDLNDPHTYEMWKRGEIRPYDYVMGEKNLMTTVGWTDMIAGISGTNNSALFSSSSSQLAVGDSSTAASAGQTDLQAAAGTKLNASDAASATGTPIVITATFSPTPTVGEVVVCAGFGGAQAANINQTFELSAASAAAVTLLNSTGGTITVAGGTVKPINYYRQLVNGSPGLATNTIQFVSVFGANNANHAWNEFATTTGGAATNKEAQAPPVMLNRAVASNGTKAQGSSWTLTETITYT